MNNNNEITVYWAPSKFTDTEASWNLMYSEPKSILKKFIKESSSGAEMAMCPATKNLFKNIYSLNSNVSDEFEISPGMFNNLESVPTNYSLGQSKISFSKVRNSSFSGYINVSYNLGWLFFASEPLEIRLTSPFFPNSEICPGSLFSPGQMDIGRWYRPINLDWHIPSDTKNISISSNQELAYIEFMTDKKIIFKRYGLTDKLRSLSDEAVESPARYGRNLPIVKRYEMAKNSGITQIVLSEIQKNLI
jgi:hypothetical protein